MYRDNDQRDFARRLRNQPTGAEQRLWFLLRAGQLNGCKFRRQAALGPYIVDFICFAQRLIVELDGPQIARTACPSTSTPPCRLSRHPPDFFGLTPTQWV